MRLLGTLVATIAASAVCAVPASAAGIWTPIDSGTTDTITAVEFQGGGRLWYTTASGKIFKRDGAPAQKAIAVGVSFNDIAFQPGGAVGVAVGTGGKLLRSTNAGESWSAAIPLTTRTSCTDATAKPLNEDLLAVAWADPTTVYAIGSGRGQIQKSSDAGATWTEVGRIAGPRCRVNDDLTDVAPVFGSTALFLISDDFGKVYFSSDALGSDPATKGTSVNNFTGRPRLAVDQNSPNRLFSSDQAPGRLQFQFSEDSANNFNTQEISPSGTEVPPLFDVSAAPGVGLVVGNAGGIFNSLDGRTAYYRPADGVLATKDWKAVDLASATDAVVGGTTGALIQTNQANSIPDLVAPAGTITGPATATAGVPTTFTANVADNAGGSGIDPAGFAWTASGVPGAAGNPVQLTFPSAGTYTVNVAFKDLAGNLGTASATITVSAPKPVVPTKSISYSGGTIKLSIPGSCVKPGTVLKATLSFKRKIKKGNRFVSVTKVLFRIDSNAVNTDKKAPFKQTLQVGGLTPGTTHTLSAKATIKVAKLKKGQRSPSKTIKTTFRVCT